jgi:predicted nucleic acid-binding protein
MSVERPRRGLVDTNILILRRWIDPAELPAEMAISAITLAELSAGPHQVHGDGEHGPEGEAAERARRMDVLQRAEAEFDPIPFDAEAARAYGQVVAATVAAGRRPRPRVADLMIAASAIAEGLPLYTANPDDFKGLEALVTVVPVTRPRDISRSHGGPEGQAWPALARRGPTRRSREAHTTQEGRTLG